jgi:hypothetical protein
MDTISIGHIAAKCLSPTIETTPIYLLLSQAGAITMTHTDYSGTCVFYLVLDGVKTFYVSLPTSWNTRLFAAYLELKKKNNPNLLFESHRLLEGLCEKIVVTRGQAIILPANTPHMVHSISDSVVIGMNVVHVSHIYGASEVYRLERIENADYDLCQPNFLYIAACMLIRYMTT